MVVLVDYIDIADTGADSMAMDVEMACLKKQHHWYCFGSNNHYIEDSRNCFPNLHLLLVVPPFLEEEDYTGNTVSSNYSEAAQSTVDSKQHTVDCMQLDCYQVVCH